MSYFWIVVLAAFVIFLIRVLADMIASSGNINAFYDRWMRKTLWIWLPFYALQRLVREMFLKK